jgi:hypothetical protein
VKDQRAQNIARQAAEKRVLELSLQSGKFTSAINAGLRSEHFTVPAYAALLEHAQKAAEGGLGVDKMLAFVELQKTLGDDALAITELDDVGSGDSTGLLIPELAAEVVQLARNGKVEELTRRAAMLAKEGRIQEAIELSASIEGASIANAEKWHSLKWNMRSAPVEQQPLLKLRDTVIATAGNIGATAGAKGSGKSHFNAAMARAVMGMENTFELECDKPGGVALLDFEQSPYHFDRLCRAIIAGNQGEHQLHAFRAGDLDHTQRMELLNHVARIEGLRAILIDGYVDLDPSSVLDPKPAAQIVSRCMAIAAKINGLVWGVIHLNPGAEAKTRGHIGSELERKGETVLQIDRTSTGHVMFTQKARNAAILKNNGIRFEWSNLLRNFQTIPGTESDQREARKTEELEQLANAISEHGTSFTYSELVDVIMRITGKKERTARNRIDDLLTAKMAKKDGNSGNYFLP